MTAISTLISAGGGGGGGSFPTIFLSSSQTWVPPMDGNICIHVIGAGGTGASASSGHPGSGGAGSYARSTNWAVTTADSYTVVIGAGGADKEGGGHSEHRGGTSQFYNASNSINMNCPGGYGGLANGYNQQTTVAYASGGTHANNAGGPGKMYWGQYAGGGAVGINASGVSGNFDIGKGGFGGECDVVGDLWSSSLGNLAGGVRGKGWYSPVAPGSHAGLMAGTDGGPLSGGGYCRGTTHTTSTYMRGGDGGIGAGGGGVLNYSGGGAIGGKGGEGIVVIQYIP